MTVYDRVIPRYQRYWRPDQELSFETVFRFMCDNWPMELLVDRNPFVEGSAENRQFVAALQDYTRTRFRKYLDLPDVPVVRLPSKRRMQQPTLKIPYDSLHDIRMRLGSSLIFVGSVLYYVREVVEIENEFLLVLEDRDGTRYKCWYKNDAIDLRSLEPQYIRYPGQPGFLRRTPSRQQRQGMLFENIYCKAVGRNDVLRLSHVKDVIDGVTTDVSPWSPTYQDLMLKLKAVTALRLSKDIALYAKKDKVLAEYRGRYLGEVRDDVIAIDTHDMARPWVVNAVRQIGCDVEAQDA